MILRSSWAWLASWLVAAALTGLVVGALGPDLAVLFGYRTLGPLAQVGQPFARVVAVGAAATAVAGLLTAVILAPGDPRGALSHTGYAALRPVRPACLGLVLAALTIALLTVAETVGIRPGLLLADPRTLLAALVTASPSAGWAVTALVAALVGGLAGAVLTWRGAGGLLLLLLAGLAVPPATSVPNSERAHDWYGDALTVHSVAATLWLGSAIATAGLLRRAPGDPAALRRHDRIALGCSVVVAVSGLVPAALDIGLDGWESGYGLLVAASAVLLVGGLVAARSRRRCGSQRRLLATEFALLAAATLVGVALTRVVPPDADATASDRLVFLLGYTLPPRMGLAELAGWWRIDLIFAPAALVAVAWYLVAVRRVRRAGGPWPGVRTAAWTAGCLTVLVATSSGIGAYATAVFSAHLLGHALLSTVAPLLLVLGHPLTLARQTPTPVLDAILDAAPLRALNRPAVAWVAAAVAVFGLYATGLFAAVVREHWAHPAMDALALLGGLVLFRALVGAREPARPAIVRLGQLFAVMMLHAAFAIWLLAQPSPLAGSFYAAVALPFVPDLLAAQRQGAVIAWLVSDLALAVAALVVARSAMSDTAAPVARVGPNAPSVDTVGRR